MNHLYHSLLRGLLLALLSFVLTACSAPRPQGDSAPVAMMPTSLSGVGHLGARVGISKFSVNGYWAGSASGWGGGGGGVSGGFSLPAEKTSTPYMVKVKWETCDTSHIKYINGKRVDPDAECISSWHEAMVPVHFDVPAGKGYGLKIHFLPGNKVEAWYTLMGPNAPDYPGPAYPRGPAPDYAPGQEPDAVPTTSGAK